jgi:hypothetical protein
MSNAAPKPGVLASLLDALAAGTTLKWAVEHGPEAVERAWADGREANAMVRLLDYCGLARVDVMTNHRGIPAGGFEWFSRGWHAAVETIVRVETRDGRDYEDDTGDVLGAIRAVFPRMTLARLLDGVPRRDAQLRLRTP